VRILAQPAIQPTTVGPAPRRARKSTPPTVAASPGDLQLAAARADLGLRFGQDFSQVPVHTSAAGAEQAAAIGAAAFTVGPDIFLGRGLPDASSPYTRRLLAHEFAHVAQHTLAYAGGPARSPDAVSSPSDPAETEAAVVGEAAVSRTGPLRVTPRPQAASVAHRDTVHDAAHHPTGFEFRAGVELRPEFMRLAQRLLAGGVLHARGLRALHDNAIVFHGSVDDHERMFMAGLTVPRNAVALSAVRIAPGAAVTFPLATITPNMPAVIDIGREPMPRSVQEPLARGAEAIRRLDIAGAVQQATQADVAAEREIRTIAGSFGPAAAATISFAQARGVGMVDVLDAMLAAASDSTPADRVAAGMVFTTARAAGLPIADEVKAGHVKVDAVEPSVFARIPGATGKAAFYATVAQESGVKGDTIYLPTTLDITDLADRSVVVHELTHAQDDRAAGGGRVQSSPTDQVEANAYRAQGRYLLLELEATPAASRPAVMTRVEGRAGVLAILGMVIESLADRRRFEPLVVALAAAGTPPVAEPAIRALLNRGAALLQADLLARIAKEAKLVPGQTSVLDGLAGESLVSWIFRN
jgi:Domain of unknown function (DUF4157)